MVALATAATIIASLATRAGVRKRWIAGSSSITRTRVDGLMAALVDGSRALTRVTAPVRNRALGRDRALVRLDDALGDCKPEAGAFAGVAAALARPHELIEHMRQNLGPDAGPVMVTTSTGAAGSARASSLMRAAAPP